MQNRRLFSITGGISMALVASRSAALADRFEALAAFELATDEERDWAAQREADVRHAIKTNTFDLTMLVGGLVVCQYGPASDRWHWVFEDGELQRAMTDEELATAEQRLSQGV